MHHWLEQWEIKHAEFEQCIRSFKTLDDVWTTISKAQTLPGHAAYARKQAHIYKMLQSEASKHYKDVGEQSLRQRAEGESLADAITKWRVEVEVLPGSY